MPVCGLLLVRILLLVATNHKYVAKLSLVFADVCGLKIRGQIFSLCHTTYHILIQRNLFKMVTVLGCHLFTTASHLVTNGTKALQSKSVEQPPSEKSVRFGPQAVVFTAIDASSAASLSTSLYDSKYSHSFQHTCRV